MDKKDKIKKGIDMDKKDKIKHEKQEKARIAAHYDMENRKSKIAMDIFKRPAFDIKKKGNCDK